ncbi:3-hydroxyanthranilic acid dioxygenase [Thelephora ganbajun]|uniref:3-hydroxyanthranilic acid dioxygenase n=1 Tax=Thelephora ganbajun TaxID=370292 RepID=A0ACB6ZKE2_THEGA|nr:3-hydroxyanthranilic acid dioxygenase [Thelephora ganbajun]
MGLLPPINIPKWLEENGHLLQPPIGNHTVYDGNDFMVMLVGGPNERNDYHINETEEWFYQWKGDMLLKVVDGVEFRDIPIQEGSIFLLPPNTPHSPIRFPNTVGIVIEGARPKVMKDRLRWYCKNPVHTKPTIIREVVVYVELKSYVEAWMADESLRKCKECGTVAPPKHLEKSSRQGDPMRYHSRL